jgi:CRP-like cAMP-binding protein
MFTDPFLKLEALDFPDDRDQQILGQSVSQITSYPARTTIVRAHAPLTESKLLLEGYVSRCKDLASGQRQIVGLHIAGDFVDLHGFVLKKLDHDIVALTPVRMASIPHAALVRVTEANPQLARALWFRTLRDASMHREWILSVGQRSGVGRIAHLLCEMYMRCRAVGLVDRSSFPFPLTQIELGEACGMTSVHTNRMLQQLRREQAIRVSMKQVTVLDWDRLAEIAEFDPSYLYLGDVKMSSLRPMPRYTAAGSCLS